MSGWGEASRRAAGTDEGVRLESKDGETVATGRVVEACTNVVRVKFDAAIPPGAYRIVIVTRDHRGDYVVEPPYSYQFGRNIIRLSQPH